MSGRNLLGKVENIQKYKDPSNSKKHIWEITITDEETGNLEKIRLQGCDPPTPDQGDISIGHKIEAFSSQQEGGFSIADKVNNWSLNKTIQFKPCKENGGGGIPIKPIAIGAVVVMIVAGIALSGVFEPENKAPIPKITKPIINDHGFYAIPQGYSYTYQSGSIDNDGKITKTEWTFPDGIIKSGSSVKYAINTLGTNSVKLAIWDDDNRKVVHTLPINVYKPYVVVPNDKFVDAFALAINNDPSVMTALSADYFALADENSPVFEKFYTSNEVKTISEKYSVSIPTRATGESGNWVLERIGD